MCESLKTVINNLESKSSRQYLTSIEIGMLSITYPREQSYDLVGLVQVEVARLGLRLEFMKVDPRGVRYDLHMQVKGELTVVDTLFDTVLATDNVVLMEV